MTNLDDTACQPRVVFRAFTLALVIVAILMQSLVSVVHPYQHGIGTQYLAPAGTLIADSTNSAYQTRIHDRDDVQCALCLALHGSSNFVSLKANPFIVHSPSSDCYIPGPVFRPLDSRRYSLAQQRAPPLSV